MSVTPATNAVIGFPRWTEEAVFSAGGGSWSSGDYPIANLASLPLQRVARSNSAAAAATQFVATLPGPLPVRLMGFVNHNATIDALFRVRVYRDAGMTDLAFDSGGVEFYPPVYATADLAWEDPRWWSGKYSARELRGYRGMRPIWLPQTVSAQAIQAEVIDPGNPAGFFECGLFEIAQAWQLGVNFKYGSSFGYRNRSAVLEAEGGAKYISDRENPRTFVGSIDYLGDDEAKAMAFEFQRQIRTAKPFLWLPNPTATRHLLRESWLARQVEMPPIELAYYGRDTIGLNFEEVL